MKREPKKVHVICGLLRGGRTNRPTQELSRITSFLRTENRFGVSTTKRVKQRDQVKSLGCTGFTYIFIQSSYLWCGFVSNFCLQTWCAEYVMYIPVTAVHPGWHQQMDDNGCNLHEWVLWSIHILMHPNAYIMHGASTPYICSARIHLGFPDFQMLSLWLSSFCPLD